MAWYADWVYNLHPNWYAHLAVPNKVALAQVPLQWPFSYLATMLLMISAVLLCGNYGPDPTS